MVAIAVAIALSGCVSRPKVYSAPDASKVTATTTRLSAAIKKTDDAIAVVEIRAQAAQESSDKVASHSASVLQLIKELAPFIPPEQKEKFDALQAAADAQIVEEGNLSTIMTQERGEITQLKAKQADVVKERDQLVKTDIPNYQAAAKRIADSATAESAAKVDVQKQLVSQKLLGIFWKIGGGLFVVILIGAGVLFALGKLGWAGAKIAAKFP